MLDMLTLDARPLDMGAEASGTGVSIGRAWAAIWAAGVWATGVWAVEEGTGPTPDVSSSGFSRRRTAMFARRNADYLTRRT